MSLEDAFSRLRATFAAHLPDRLAQLRLAVEAACTSEAAASVRTALDEAAALSHKLAGSSGTFGYPALGEEALAVEQLCRDLLDADSGLPGDSRDHLRNLFARMTAAVAAAASPRPVATPATATAEAGRIFLVGRNGAPTASLANELSLYGYTVTSFDDVDRLRSAARSIRPGAVVVDADAPNGHESFLEAARWFNQDEAKVPVAILSDRTEFDARLAATQAGGDAYFTKPVDAFKLAEALDRLIAAVPPNPYRILIVEDDDHLRAAYTAALASAGMIVNAVADPRTAFHSLLDNDIDLILMDLYLPHCSGIELAKMIRQQDVYASVPIVFLSTEARIDRKLLAMSLGGDDFLTKPVRTDHLIAAVTGRVQRARLLRSHMVRDSLTGLLNHAAILKAVDAEIARSRRSGDPFSVALVDIDRFKSINDRFGHPTGDRVIKALSRCLQQRLRRTDVIGRYGGEEFAVILVGADADPARKVMDAIRGAFAQQHFSQDQVSFLVSFSCGIASFDADMSASELVAAADAALYSAKNAGRNRVVLAPRPPAAADAQSSPGNACSA